MGNFFQSYSNAKHKHVGCNAGCLPNSMENACRDILEFLLDIKLPKRRPFPGIYGIGNDLELDMFNEELKLAFCYNGKYHYNLTWPNKSKKDLLSIIKKDLLRERLCAKVGIKRVILDYRLEYFSSEALGFILESILIDNKILIKRNWDYELFKRRQGGLHSKIQEAIKSCDTLGYTLIDTLYRGTHERYEVDCGVKEHTYTPRLERIISGGECYECKQENFGNAIRDTASKMGLKVLAPKVIYNKSILKFKCHICSSIGEIKVSSRHNYKTWCSGCGRLLNALGNESGQTLKFFRFLVKKGIGEIPWSEFYKISVEKHETVNFLKRALECKLLFKKEKGVYELNSQGLKKVTDLLNLFKRLAVS